MLTLAFDFAPTTPPQILSPTSGAPQFFSCFQGMAAASVIIITIVSLHQFHIIDGCIAGISVNASFTKTFPIPLGHTMIEMLHHGFRRSQGNRKRRERCTLRTGTIPTRPAGQIKMVMVQEKQFHIICRPIQEHLCSS